MSPKTMINLKQKLGNRSTNEHPELEPLLTLCLAVLAQAQVDAEHGDEYAGFWLTDGWLPATLREHLGHREWRRVCPWS